MTRSAGWRVPFAWLASIALLAPRAHAQEHPITWSLSVSRQPVAEGRAFIATLRAEIPTGWHLYSTTQPPGGPVPTAITLPGDGDFFLTAPITFPPPDVAADPNFNIVTETYLDSATYALSVAARRSGHRTLAINVAYQTCTDRYCLPPTSDTVSLALTVAPGTGGGLPAAPAAPPGSAPSTSLPLFLWLAAVMGAVSLLTPCVFPMIPITVSYFTRTEGAGRGSPARGALTYGLGIMATFTLFGLGVAVLVGAGGINRFAADPWVNLLVTAIFVAFALNLFGVYHVAVPGAVLTRLDGAARRGRRTETIGIVLMAFTFTLTSFTCTAPFVGTLLVMAAQGSWRWPLFGLLVFSTVFALPFFLLALMPSAIARLPRSGRWLQSVKIVMGFAELATAMKFLSNADMVWRWGVFTRQVVLGIWCAIALATAAYLAGGLPWRRDRRGLAGWIGTVAALALAAYLALGLRGARLGELESFLPPPEGIVTGGSTSVPGELPWMVNDYAGALARGRAEQKAVVVDFTGYTCTNCRWMEANMFPRPAVAAQLGRMVRVRLYTDGQGELYQRQQRMELDKFGTVALPYYAVVDTDGTVLSQFLGMTRSTDEYLRFLNAHPR